MQHGAETATDGRGHFPCFDGLRAVAALSVFAFHFLGMSNPAWLRGDPRDWVWRLGLQGVCIFFVISGFLLYRPFVDAAFRGVPSPSIGRFWERRFVRIFPAYWVALTAFVYFFGFFRIHGVVNFVTYYGLLQNYRGGYALFGLGIAWTLVIEVGFYLALPLINHVARAITGAHAPLERVLRVQLGVVVALAGVGALVKALNIWVWNKSTPGAWFPLHSTGYSTLGYLDWFAIGMAFAILSAWSTNGRRLPKTVVLFSRHAGVCWLVALGCFAIQTRLPLTSVPPLVRFALPFVVAVAAAFLVFPAVFGAQDEGAVRWFLQTKSMTYLGGISYGIYLCHFIFVSQSLRWVANGTLPDVLLVRFVTVAFLTLAAASASFYLIEKPLISLTHRRVARTTPTSAPDRAALYADSDRSS